MTDTELLLKILEKLERIENKADKAQKCSHPRLWYLQASQSDPACPDCGERVNSGQFGYPIR